MALVALTDEEIGLRISWLWRRADWRTARDLARAMKEKDLGIFTKLEKGKSITPQRIGAIADLCANRGDIVVDAEIVLGFLHGTKDKRDLTVRFRLLTDLSAVA